MEDYLILVDEHDKQYGKLEKQLVHELGLLHRAFSVFIFNTKGELLLQQRADEKYHSAGLWTNTCCSHPRFGEEIKDAVTRRLEEEMGMFSEAEFAFNFIYKANFENGLTEHELDHVFFGTSDELPLPNKSEVKNWKYLPINLIRKDMAENPHQYTVWFKMVFERVMAKQAALLVA
ncbi:MAG: isopentenyl-diphosphate Delta-isomerase [Bacteroidia bacterium]